MSKRTFTADELCNNDVLKLLNEHGLLFYSNQYEDTTEQLFKQKKAQKFQLVVKVIEEIQKNPAQALKKSITAFDLNYQAMSLVGQEMLLQTIRSLIAIGEERGNSFQGLTLQTVPKFKNEVRQEEYDFVAKEVPICFYPFSEDSFLYNTLKPTQTLIHELTHGLDHALGMPSYKNMLSYLTKQEGAT